MHRFFHRNGRNPRPFCGRNGASGDQCHSGIHDALRDESAVPDAAVSGIQAFRQHCGPADEVDYSDIPRCEHGTGQYDLLLHSEEQRLFLRIHPGHHDHSAGAEFQIYHVPPECRSESRLGHSGAGSGPPPDRLAGYGGFTGAVHRLRLRQLGALADVPAGRGEQIICRETEREAVPGEPDR